MNKDKLIYASEKDLKRLAKFLNIDVQGLSKRQMAIMIFCMITMHVDKGMY